MKFYKRILILEMDGLNINFDHIFYRNEKTKSSKYYCGDILELFNFIFSIIIYLYQKYLIM